ncbi:MAG TPA: hypothetical protein VFH56_06070 [Acidimicrobiales bacterium]|nr:hypothetical protein [Acidimicrobiales bacterium]
MARRLPNRVLTAVTILFAAAAALMLGVALAGPNADAVPSATSTTGGCGLVTCTTSASPTTVPVASTAPPSTAPRTTSAPTTRPAVRQTFPFNPTSRTTIPASTTSTTNTTLPSIGGNLPVTPSTVPFTTKQQSSHVSPVFAALSGIGFFLALIIVAVRFWFTRPPRQPRQ